MRKTRMTRQKVVKLVSTLDIIRDLPCRNLKYFVLTNAITLNIKTMYRWMVVQYGCAHWQEEWGQFEERAMGYS